MFNDTCCGAMCSFQLPADSPSVPLESFAVDKTAIRKEPKQLSIKGRERLVPSLKKSELNISTT